MAVDLKQHLNAIGRGITLVMQVQAGLAAARRSTKDTPAKLLFAAGCT